ncbi:MAG: hypothetical protein AUJ75_03225 [Candidatus Omnitrophica bacterium CG1_02_49_10]|nr:MAG: hypothetical protein AUJ75_03225 [Candidatus Omnitrophica bacterium CG1_02_49_10]
MGVGDFGHCCETCQVYWTCETKWYRGERQEENICCTVCNYYNECLESSKKKSKKTDNKS